MSNKNSRGFAVTEAVIILAILGLIALFVYGIYREMEDRAEWEGFSKAHDCRKVPGMVREGETYTYYIQSGSVLMPVTGKKADRYGYECDDGQIYWR